MDNELTNTNTKTNSNAKEQLISNIREWIKIDNEIKKIKNDLKEKTTQKKSLADNLVTVMKSNSIDCFDINGGSLIYKQKKTKNTISGKFLLNQLEQYYKESPEVAKDITKHILDNRVETVKDEIKLK